VRPAVQPGSARSRRPWLWLGIGLAVTVVLAGVVTAGVLVATRSRSSRADLVMTLRAQTSDGAAPPSAALRAAAGILLDRLSAAGYDQPRVQVTDDRTVVATVRGGDPDGLRLLAGPGRLSFRAVVAGPAVPHAEPVPSGTGAPASPPASPTPAASGAPGGVPAAVVAKLGAAYPAAQGLTDPGQVAPDRLGVLAPFGMLTPDEVATLPPAMQYAVPTITCDQLNARPAGAVDDPAVRVVACERTGTQAKYLLDPARVTAADVAGANVELQAASGWTVTVTFTAAGQPRWTALTESAVAGSPSNQVAIVVDNEVITAPTVQAVLTGDATISGAAIDQDAARQLAAQLRSGPLPVTFTVTAIGRA